MGDRVLRHPMRGDRAGSGSGNDLFCHVPDCQRFTRSEQAVRHSGLDVTVDTSDRRRAGGFLTRQGPQTLRWALYEAAKNASHQRSPDHDYYGAPHHQACHARRAREQTGSGGPQPGSARHGSPEPDDVLAVRYRHCDGMSGGV